MTNQQEPISVYDIAYDKFLALAVLSIAIQILCLIAKFCACSV